MGDLYALDFDGVLCDSCGESSRSALKAAKIRWPHLFNGVDSSLEQWVLDQMHFVRPVVETGYENLLLVRLLLELQIPSIRKSSVAAGLTVEGILENWSKLKPVIMEEWNENRDALIDLFGKVRDEWIDNDLSGWISANRFYPGVADALKFASSRVYIVTTKQSRFADALLRELAGVTIPSERIYGLGTGPKVEVLKQLQRKSEHEGLRLHFVEDRIATLKNVIKEPELDGWNLYLGTMSHYTSSSSSASTVQGSSHEGRLPPITFGENGQPIGDNSVQLSSKIGDVVRTYVSPAYLKWTDVPNELKELVWEIVRHSFEVPEYTKRLILKKANNSWKDWKSNLRLKVLDKYQTDAERKSNIPEGVKKEDWETFVELNSTSQARSLRQKGKAARKALKCPHTSGRKGQARVAAELSQQNPDGLVTRTQVYLATHGRKDGATGNQYLDEIDMLIQRDPTIVEKDLNHDPVALALGRDNRGHVRGLGMGVSKTAVHHSTPYRRYEMASQAAIKTAVDAVDELKEQNIQLRERLEEESRERKRMEKRILSCLSQGQTVMQPSTDNGRSSQVRRDLPPQDARSCRLMHLTRKSTCIAYGRVRGLSTEEEECYKVIVDEIIEGSVELMGGGKSFQDLTLGDTIDWPIFRTIFI